MTNFPGSADSFPSAVTLATHRLNTDPHSTLHGNLGEALTAVEKVVLGPAWVNVRAYGALGDGTTDDTVAIQAAITAAGTGSAVYLPPGIYVISSALSMGGGGNLSLIGSGYRSTTLFLKNGSNSSMITTPDDGVQRYGLFLSNFSLDGNAANQTGSSPAIFVRGMNEARIDGVYVNRPRGDGIRFGQATVGMYCTVPILSQLIIRGVGSQGAAINMISGSSDAIISNCDIGFFSLGAGVLFAGHNGYTVSNVNVWQCYYGYQTFQADRGRFIACLSDLSLRHGFITQESDILQFVGCQARESSQATASTYDGFHFEGTGGAAATDIVMTNCWSVGAQARVGVALQNDLNRVGIHSTVVSGNAVAPVVVGSGVTNYQFSSCLGYNPVASASAPAFPATTVAVNNGSGVDVTAYVKAGTSAITQVTVAGFATGLNIAISSWGTVKIPANTTVAFTYGGGTPTWTWVGE